jgi:hypothetical protein
VIDKWFISNSAKPLKISKIDSYVSCQNADKT